MKAADADGDGKLSYSEFKHIIKVSFSRLQGTLKVNEKA